MDKKIFIATVALLCGNAFSSDASYPNKPIKIIVPWAAGSSTDATTRILAFHLEKRLGKSVIVENKAGADGIIGANIVAKSKPDGYTLIMASNSTHGANSALHKNLSYDPIKDFDPIVNFSSMFYVLLTSAKSNFKSMDDVLNGLNKDPSKYIFAGTSGISALTAQQFINKLGKKIDIVPYKDASQAFTDLSAERTNFLFLSPAAAGSQIESGRLKPLAISAKERSSMFPGTPTLIESKVSGFESYAWIGILGPAGMPVSVIEKLNKEINNIIKDERAITEFQNKGTPKESLVGGSSTDFKKTINKEIEKWRGMNLN